MFNIKQIAKEITEEIIKDIGIDEMLKLLKQIDKHLAEIKVLLAREKDI